MPYRWILFDADGTLFDYDFAESAALEASFQQVQQPYRPEYTPIYRQINARFWEAFERGEVNQNDLRVGRFEELLKTIGLDHDATDFSNRYLKNLSTQRMLIPNAHQILEDLSGQCQFMIVTNGLKDVQRPRFSQSDIYHYFFDVIISEEIGVAKPDTGFFDVAFERMNDPAKEDVLIVGDSLSSDITGGNNYHIDTCWYNPEQKEANPDLKIHYEITSLNELKDIVKKRSK